jgi:hypothetical protein
MRNGLPGHFNSLAGGCLLRPRRPKNCCVISVCDSACEEGPRLKGDRHPKGTPSDAGVHDGSRLVWEPGVGCWFWRRSRRSGARISFSRRRSEAPNQSVISCQRVWAGTRFAWFKKILHSGVADHDRRTERALLSRVSFFKSSRAVATIAWIALCRMPILEH